MKVLRWAVSCLIGFMVLAPFARRLEPESQASAGNPAAFQPALLLSHDSTLVPGNQLPLLERTVIIRHTVEPNEDVLRIVKTFDVDQASIRSSNDLDTQFLKPGTELCFPNHKGTLYEVKTPKTLREISSGFKRSKDLGSDVFDREILLANDFPPPNLSAPDFSFMVGTVLFLPQAWRPSGLPYPFTREEGRIRISSGFGMRRHPILGVTRAHRGYDIPKPYGTPVYAPRAGVVVFTGWSGGYGNMIKIRHEMKKGTYYTIYGHLSKILVREGQHIVYLQKIGLVGSTGLSTGPHLHFEVRDANDRPQPPSYTL